MITGASALLSTIEVKRAAIPALSMVEITGLVHAVELHTARFKSFASSLKNAITGMFVAVRVRVEYLPTLSALAIVERVLVEQVVSAQLSSIRLPSRAL